MSELSLWSGPKDIDVPSLPPVAASMRDLVGYANKKLLPVGAQRKIISAFEINACDMSVSYIWRYTMGALKEKIASLGMKFVGEMLGRNDIDEYSSPDAVLTDYDAITLAEQLGIVNKEGGMELRHAQESLSYYLSRECEAELSMVKAAAIISDSIRFVLGQPEITIALEFNKFRSRLQTESLTKDDDQIITLINSQLFYIRTVVNVLLNNIKTTKSATLEISLANLSLILPMIWEKLADKDKWNVGMTYRDVVTDGNDTAAMSMKRTLMKVRGFDFVPESLRSNTFRKAAKSLIDTHFAYNNFYNEPSAVRNLAKLGSIIPGPALDICMDAYLLVCIGSEYGVSVAAVPLAKDELRRIGHENWEHYFEKIMPKDETVLVNLRNADQVNRFSVLLSEIGPEAFHNLSGEGKELYDAISKNNFNRYIQIRKRLLQML